MNEVLRFDIASLLKETTGQNEVYSFDGPVKFDGIDVKSNAVGKVEIMKLDDSLNARVEDFTIKLGFLCDKCLKKITTEIHIKHTERRFFLEKPEVIEDENDLFLVDKKHLIIDLSEMLKQEIILHFPIISVCSKSCKGLCPVCGKDLNKSGCKCEILDSSMAEQKPLAKLKDLLK